MNQNQPPSRADAETLQREKELFEPIARQQRSGWARNLSKVVAELVTDPEPHWAVRELFWVRLYAVLEELARLLERDLNEGSANVPVVKKALACIERIRSEFSEDELLWVDCMRHTYVHIEQVSTRLTLKKDGKLADTRPVKLVDKTLSKADIQARWHRYFGAHYGGESSAKPAD